MKQNSLYILLIAILLLASCTREDFSGEGYLSIGLKLTTAEENATTRVLPTTEELNNSCAIKIRNASGGLIREYQGLGSVPSQLQLSTGNYGISATAGTKEDVAFDAPYYEGKANFKIEKGNTTIITLPVYLQNTLVKMAYTESAANKFATCKVVVSMSKGQLEFDKAIPDQTGYYIMPNGETELDWTLEARTVDGISYTKKGTLSKVKASTKYTLNFDYKELEPEDGGMYLQMEVIEEPVDPRECIFQIGRAPTIERLDNAQYLSLSDPLNFSLNDAGREVVIAVRTSSELKSLSLSCPEFKSLVGLSFETFDIQTLADNVRVPLREKGISYASEYNMENDYSIAQITFSAKFFQFFTAGGKEATYYVNLKAVDAQNRYRNAQMQIMISNAIVKTQLVDIYDVWAHRAKLKANVNIALYEGLQTEEEKALSFEYRKKGDNDWARQPAELSGSTMSTSLSNLEDGTNYQYRAICAAQSADAATIYEFTTETATQLSNGGFEGWNKPGDVWLIYQSGDKMFWDSGNHGSATLKKNITNYDETPAYLAPGTTGSRSIKMVSQKVALMGIGKFAAGNAFVGQYISTDGTDGILGFGRPFSSRPTKLRGYLKYNMQPIAYTSNAVPNVKSGDNDNAHIYVAVGDWANETGIEPPILIKTSVPKLFDKTGTGVIAYGEKIQTSSTESEGLEYFEINLEYKDFTRKAKYIVLVASASRYGDYFVGGEGSTLWLDDLELVYE